MITIGSGICLIISVLATLVMVLRNYDHIAFCDGVVSALLPFLITVYWLKAQVSSPEAALVLIALIDIAASLLMAVLLFSMLRGIGVRVPVWVRAIVYGAVTALFFPVWKIFHSGKSADYVEVFDTGDGYASRMKGTFSLFEQYAFLLALILLMVCVAALFLSRRKTYSRRAVAGYLAFASVWLAMSAAETLLKTDFSGLPFLYMLADVLIVLTYDQVHSHDLSALAAGRNAGGARGCVLMGLNGKYLGSDEKALDFFPELRQQRRDTFFPKDSVLGSRFARLIRNYTENIVSTGSFRSGDRILAYEISDLAVRKGGPSRGYLIDLRDATVEKRNLEILTGYNTQLNQEVAEKTRNIESMQEKLILSMADMVENRDGNTGGHVRRTSDIVAILVREIREKNLFPLEETLARDIVRTAPMHDLGKVSIDSGILNKPARLTPEEYAIMKTHSTLSGQMVKILLEGVEEEQLVQTAYRLARHHHERWDGKGYPDGLVGEMIPLEARIMAVADVYDALVSKRVYKEPMSFEKAAQIMCEGMGTQFDPNMRLVFLSCRQELERYYSSL
jgi:hypothetical protein